MLTISRFSKLPKLHFNNTYEWFVMKLHYNYTAVNITIQPAGYSCPLTFVIIRFYLFTNSTMRKPTKWLLPWNLYALWSQLKLIENCLPMFEPIWMYLNYTLLLNQLLSSAYHREKWVRHQCLHSFVR